LLAAQTINDFITAHGKAICDGCIVRALGLAAHAQSAQITAALGTTSDFTRKRGHCSVCGNERLVIYATPRDPKLQAIAGVPTSGISSE
jgi:hypothetical protein